jgi:hypothetical protein
MPTASIIDQLLPNEILGKDLYHYTSVEGLLGILSDRVIRCSHVFYLNDIEENLNGWEFFFKTIDSHKSNHKQFEKFRAALREYFDHYKKLDYNELSNQVFSNMHEKRMYSFIFSLSLIEDDLNQWRSYAEEPFGFSIRFNFDENFWRRQPLFRDGENCSILLRQCVYDPEQKKEKLIKLLYHHFQNYLAKKESWEDALFNDLLTLSLFFKNEKFKAEKECRLVITTSLEPCIVGDKEVSLLKMRKGKSYLIPFIELLSKREQISRITIGPTPFKEHSLSAMQMLQNSLPSEFSHIEIRHSKVPYRSW